MTYDRQPASPSAEQPSPGLGNAGAMDRLLAAVIRRRPVTCRPDDSIESALRAMDSQGVGSVIVTGEGATPLGIVTLHDLLGRVVLPRRNLFDPVSGVMSPVVSALPATATAYEAALEMVSRGVRHVVVVDSDGKVAGVVSEKDLFDLQRLSMRQLSHEILRAPDISALAGLAEEVRGLARSRLADGVSAEQLTRFIASLNDLLTRRVLDLELAGANLRGIAFCWLAFGSEGRLEQTLATDQDNGLIFEVPEGLSADGARELLLPLARRVNESLAACGFPLCKGGIMAGNPRWCLSAGEWRTEFAQWMDSGSPDSLLNATIFFDLRPLHGAERLAAELRAWLAARAADSPRFLHQMAENALQNRPPLGLVRDFSVESGGEHRGTIDLKINGSAIFVDAARIFALATGVTATSTATRLRSSAAALRLSGETIEAWIDAFHHILDLRLHGQERPGGAAVAANRVDPEALNPLERKILKESLRQARDIQSRLALDHTL